MLTTLLGRTIKWNAQQRAASGTGWSEAVRAHGAATLSASGWIAATLLWLDPALLVWLLPVAIPLLLSIPLSVYSSRMTADNAARSAGLFKTPEEDHAPEIIAELETHPRGLYTGAIGYFGANGDSQFSIAIRTAVADASSLHFHAGAGIVADSDPQREYEETWDKASSLLGAAEWPRKSIEAGA